MDDKGSFKIYLQDPQYSKTDELVEAVYGMVVVNFSIGHQLGWMMLDGKTLVVEFGACFPFYWLMLEIARPVGIFKRRALEEVGEMHDYNAFSYILEGNGESAVVPGVGV